MTNIKNSIWFHCDVVYCKINFFSKFLVNTCKKKIIDKPIFWEMDFVISIVHTKWKEQSVNIIFLIEGYWQIVLHLDLTNDLPNMVYIIVDKNKGAILHCVYSLFNIYIRNLFLEPNLIKVNKRFYFINRIDRYMTLMAFIFIYSRKFI
jgi:hypothetical protein